MHSHGNKYKVGVMGNADIEWLRKRLSSFATHLWCQGGREQITHTLPSYYTIWLQACRKLNIYKYQKDLVN